MFLLAAFHCDYFCIGDTFKSHSRLFERAVRCLEEPAIAYFSTYFLNQVFKMEKVSYELAHGILEEILAVLPDTGSVNLV